MLEFPVFKKWRRAVFGAATALQLSQEDMKRVEELFRILGERRCRRADSIYDGLRTWLENAEQEYDRRPFAAILATANPRGRSEVLQENQLVPSEPRWGCAVGANPARTPESLAGALSAMLVNCRSLHLIDPHFGPENPRHRRVLEAVIGVLSENGVVPQIVRVHCSEKSDLAFFESEAARMANRLPIGITVEFVRWRQRVGGDRLHNRYVLTDLGGVLFGVGLDAGAEGETDDVVLLPRDQYNFRWAQYVESGRAFEQVDTPASIRGTRTLGNVRGGTK